MKRAIAILCIFSVTILPAAGADVIDIDEDSYAAIAYSPSTGQYRCAYNYGSRGAAERAAVAACKASDARIVCWVNNGFCALALGDERGCWGVGWSYGDGASTREATGNALEECRKRTSGARIVLCLSSDGQYFYRR